MIIVIFGIFVSCKEGVKTESASYTQQDQKPNIVPTLTDLAQIELNTLKPLDGKRIVSARMWILSQLHNAIKDFTKNKKAEHSSTFFPKSYHELNLLMLWSSKIIAI